MHLVLLFFLYFSIAAKNTLCIFVFFLFFLILFQIALCLFVLWTFRQKTTPQVHQRMLYFLCSDDFVPFMVVFFCNLGLYLFCIFFCIFNVFRVYSLLQTPDYSTLGWTWRILGRTWNILQSIGPSYGCRLASMPSPLRRLGQRGAGTPGRCRCRQTLHLTRTQDRAA